MKQFDIYNVEFTFLDKTVNMKIMIPFYGLEPTQDTIDHYIQGRVTEFIKDNISFEIIKEVL